ncbi:MULTISPECIES: hypothetical protein [Roseiflexus]|jgi:SLT domain-containing protein|nr:MULTISPECIES: hypothetical protein [Roseiflexus]GIW02055.1 MAG: hypothetical protein KatS3mg058_3458 [Roseiflexus sp.]
MSDEMAKQPDETDDMLPEYDFSGGVRGKHYRAYQRGYKIIVHKIDGTTEERDYTLPEGAVMLDPDVRAYFPDAEAVNTALRGLIKLIPTKRASGKSS